MNYKINKNLTCRKLSDEYFVLNRTTGYVHTFNDTGVFIWENIVENTPFEDLISKFVDTYSITLDVVKSDLIAFFKSLEEKQLITILDNA